MAALYSGFVHASGPYELENSYLSTASTAVAAGAALMMSSGVPTAATSGSRILGVNVKAKLVGDATTTPLQIFKLYTGRTEFYGPAVSSTFNTTTALGLVVDLSSAVALTTATVTNKDFAISQVLAGATDAKGAFVNRIFQ